jgi:2-dehydro-3-deoxy-D-arabinonate dehydratase
MHIVRFVDQYGDVRVGLAEALQADAPLRVFVDQLKVGSLLRLGIEDLRELTERTASTPAVSGVGDVQLLPPVDGRTEIWAAGVTYQRSREARVEESTEQSVYEKVYDAQRPELFFKALPWRVVTEGEPIAVRADSPLNVPEPELALVANRHADIVGYLVANDVSSRSIEGENPLYLPQAKVYAGSCAISAGIRPAWELPAVPELTIRLQISRAGGSVFDESISTTAFHRKLPELVDYLFQCQPFPDGAVLSTGTGIVPAIDFTLAADDRVHISIDQIGTLTNPVVSGIEALDWLVEAVADPRRRPDVQL